MYVLQHNPENTTRVLAKVKTTQFSISYRTRQIQVQVEHTTTLSGGGSLATSDALRLPNMDEKKPPFFVDVLSWILGPEAWSTMFWDTPDPELSILTGFTCVYTALNRGSSRYA